MRIPFATARKKMQSFFLNFFEILRHLWFLILFLIIGFFVLNNVDQAVDTITDVITRRGSSQSFFLYVSITVFALSVWYSARTMLFLAEVHYENPTAIIKINKWLPRLMGVFAYLSLFILLLHLRSENLNMLKEQGIDNQLKGSINTILSAANYHIAWTVLWAAGYLFFVIFRRWHAPDTRFSPDGNDIKKLSRSTRLAIGIIIPLVVAFIFMFCFRSLGSSLARNIGAVNVILFALSVYTILGMVTLYFQNHYKLPFVLFIFLAVAGFSYFNNNHQVRLTGDAAQVSRRPTIKTAFTSWIESRAIDSTEYPVFIVAAEGGGIRAAFFAAYTLALLDMQYPQFKDHVFAISSVSGGSLGAALYCALVADAAKKHEPPDSVAARTERFLQEDFLAPLNSAFVFSDFVQKILPVDFNYLDRARWLEDSWSDAYHQHTGENTFERPLFDLYTDATNNVPHLFANSTHVESGRKAVYSDLDVNADTTEYFKNDIDLAALAGRPVALRTVASMSARFPFLTPAATLQSHGKDSANFVDGGYADNSGLGTAVSITNILNTLKDSLPGIKYTVHVIQLKNSAEHKEPKPLTGIYEMRTVLSAFYNSWDNDVNRVMKNAKSYFYFSKAGGEFIPLTLNRTVGVMPLGWDLSELAYKRMSAQVNLTVKDGTEKIKMLLQKVSNVIPPVIAIKK